MSKRREVIELSLDESKKVYPKAMKVLQDELEGKEHDKEKIQLAKKILNNHLKYLKLLENEQKIAILEQQVKLAASKK